MSAHDPFRTLPHMRAAACSMLALSAKSSSAQINGGTGFSRTEVLAMVYELRVYQPAAVVLCRIVEAPVNGRECPAPGDTPCRSIPLHQRSGDRPASGSRPLSQYC